MSINEMLEATLICIFTTRYAQLGRHEVDVFTNIRVRWESGSSADGGRFYRGRCEESFR